MSRSSDHIDDPLHVMAQRHPEDVAVVAEAGQWTYGQLDQRVTGTAERLRDACGAQDRVALLLPNGVACITLCWALLRARRVPCLLSTRTPSSYVLNQVQRLGANILIAEPERWEKIAGRTGEHTITSMHPEQLIRVAAEGNDTIVRFRRDQPASVLYTSGSTGAPKAAQHSVGNHYFSALGSNQNVAVRPGDRWLLSLPLYHVGGLGILWRCWLGGGTVVVSSSPAALLKVLHTRAITHVSLVPTQLRRLLDEQPTAPHALKAVLLGGSAIPPALLDRAAAGGWPVHKTYGMTEMTSQVTTTPPHATRDQLRSAGRLLPHRVLRVADDGEILVRGPTLFQGYLGRDGTLDPAVDPEGWYHTRDIGELDASGLLHVRGRKDHLFISGGENIQPEEIEAALLRRPGVTRAVVVPVPDADYGERPVAFVDGVDDERLYRLSAELSKTLPRFKIPDVFYPWPNVGGQGLKADRTRLRRLARTRFED